MGSVTKHATLFTISESAPIPDGTGGEIATMSLGIVLGKDTPGEQRVMFMVLATDYEALGSPGFGSAIDVSLTSTT